VETLSEANRQRTACAPRSIYSFLTVQSHISILSDMSRAAKKVTVNLPTDVLERAQRITGRGITPTIIEGLRELERRAQRSALRQLRGKVRFDLDLDQTRR